MALTASSLRQESIERLGTSVRQGPSILPVPDVPPDAVLSHYSSQQPPPFLPVSSPLPLPSFFPSLLLLSPTLLPPAAIPAFVPWLTLDATPAADDAAITLMANQCRLIAPQAACERLSRRGSGWASEGVTEWGRSEWKDGRAIEEGLDILRHFRPSHHLVPEPEKVMIQAPMSVLSRF